MGCTEHFSPASFTVGVLIYVSCESRPIATRKSWGLIGGKVCNDGRAEGSNLITKPGSKCMHWPKANLHVGLQVLSSRLLGARSLRNCGVVSAVDAGNAVLFWPLVPPALF